MLLSVALFLVFKVSGSQLLREPAPYGGISELGLTETAGLQERLTGGADEVTLGTLVDWRSGDLETHGTFQLRLDL